MGHTMVNRRGWAMWTAEWQPTMMFPPVIIDHPDNPTELKYFSTSAGNVIVVTEQDEGAGMSSWREMLE